MNRKLISSLFFFLALVLLGLSACQNAAPTEIPASATTATSSPTPEGTAPTPTGYTPPTADPGIPLAAKVNGEGITLAIYQAELGRAQTASANGLANYDETAVLQNLIDERLLVQGAAQAGFIPDDAVFQTHLAGLGKSEAELQSWMSENGYTAENFEQALRRSIAAAWMRDQIASQVASTAEQVHARQILLYNASDAENALAQLQAGTDFATLAAQFDPLASGDLGWFPRGYLTVSALDDPIFALQPGEYTSIIETTLGFHIVQVIERDPQYPLSPGAYQALKIQTIQDWLAARRQQSEIEILIP